MIEEKALQMTAKWKQYSKEELQKIANESESASEFWKKLGYALKDGGKGRKIARATGLNIDHWKKQEPAKWRQYSKEELQKIADKSNSGYEFCKALGYTGDPGGKGLKIAQENQLD